MAKIIHTRDGKPYKEYTLKKGTLTVGRRPECSIQLLDDVTVSGNHAKIFVAPSTYMVGLLDVVIEDLNSTNGTMLSAKKIKKHRWKHGELIKIGLADKHIAFVPEFTGDSTFICREKITEDL